MWQKQEVSCKAQQSVSRMFLPHFDVFCHLWLITPMATCNLFLITDINQSPPCKNAIFGKVNVEDHQFFVLQECAARTLTGVKLLFWSILQFSENGRIYTERQTLPNLPMINNNTIKAFCFISSFHQNETSIKLKWNFSWAMLCTTNLLFPFFLYLVSIFLSFTKHCNQC